MKKRTLLIIGVVASAVIVLSCLGCLILGMITSLSPTHKVTVTAQAIAQVTEAAKLTDTPKPTSTSKPTNTPKPTKMPKPTNTSRPCTAFHLGTHSYTCDIPSNLVMTVGDTLTTNISNLTVDVTLNSFKETRLERRGSHKNRYFETKFLIHNREDKTVVFAPNTVFLAANDGGYRYSRGGKVDLITDDSITIEANSETLVVLEWRTDAYNTVDGKTSDQTIWITVNTPILEDIDVPLDVVSVFRIYFPELD